MMVSRRAGSFTESVIREMTRVANEHGAINLAQGFPDFAMPEPMKDAACTAIHGDLNQYAITWGSPPLRLAIAALYRRMYGMEIDPEREVTVTCGSTEAMAATFLGIFDPGDEVIILEPYYENYGPDAILAGAKPVFVALDAPSWTLDSAKLKAAITPKTKAIVVNTPHNPTGRVFTRAEIDLIAELCVEHDLWAITDGPYAFMVYAGHHHEIATWPGMRERTITISSLSKTYSCTGWRIGWAIAPVVATNAIRKVHDFLTVGAPAPLQAAAAVGLAFDADYYNHFMLGYHERRDHLAGALAEAGFRFAVPEGAYYILADFSAISDRPDVEFAHWLARDVGVATVPGSSFFSRPEDGRKYVRFAFCKKRETLDAAVRQLQDLTARV